MVYERDRYFERYFELERQRQETERQRRLDQEQRIREEIRARQEEARKMKAAAEARARMLLLAHLNDEQRKTYERSQHFDVVSNNDRTWRILTGMGQSGNVLYMEDERKIASYCCYVRDYEIPLHDHFLAQKIVLETNENYWLEIAVLAERFRYDTSGTLPTLLPAPIYDTDKKREDSRLRRVAGLIRRF